MIIYPTIELQGGRCVSLYKGRLEEPQIWHVDPVEKAQEFAEAGAEWIHVTDFDAMVGDDRNSDLLQNIIDQTGASIQLGGGFRSLSRITEWIDRGAGRIVIGTLAIMAPDMVKQAAKLYPDQIVISVDVYQGHVMGDGWREPSAIEPQAVIRSFLADPLAAIIITDIDADIGDSDTSLALVTSLAKDASAPVIANGLARSLDDLARLKYVPHVAGTIIGRALFNHTIDLKEALELGALTPEETAPFV